MTKRLLALILALAMVVCVLAACNNDKKHTHEYVDGECVECGEPDPDYIDPEQKPEENNPDDNKPDEGGNTGDHVHTFDTEYWETSDTHHWHPATCEHGEIHDSEAEHSDADEDGFCDVCEFEVGHDHTYSEEWSTSETHHWHAATCTHTDLKSGEALHSDEENDGKCDKCAAHVHNANPAGYCVHADCGKKVHEVDETNIDELVNAIFFQNYLVNGGKVDYLFTGKSNTGKDYEATRHEIIDYIFGKDNYTYEKNESSAVNAGNEAESILQLWTQLKANGETFSVYKEGEGDFRIDVSNPDRLKGPFISLSTLSGEYGVAETLYTLYLAAVDQNEDGSLIGDAEIDIREDENKVTFKYEYKTVFINSNNATGANGEDLGVIHNVNYFEVEVSFCYSDDFALTELWISCDCYTNDPGALPNGQLNEGDVDLDYDPKTGDFTLRENALADNYTIYCTQTVGERNEENPNPQSKFMPTDFDIFLELEEIPFPEEGEPAYTLHNQYTGTVSIDLGSAISFYFGNYTPSSASLKYVEEYVTMKVFYNDTELLDYSNYDNEIAAAFFTLHGEARLALLVPKKDGAYRIEIYLRDELMAEMKVNVGVVDNEHLDYDKNKEIPVAVTEAFQWTNEFTFTASKTGTYYFYLPVGFGLVDADSQDAADKTPATDDSGIIYYDFQDQDNRNSDGSYKAGTVMIKLEAGQTIRFYANAAKRGNYLITFYCF